ncbi:cytochrome c1 [Temperatibacter marinus]|uniref:Cytochrome c1 n=1 Tax=Temperatibacter marinus TaxID=1456591 RepID=A0AA52H8M3_9PROT|nr:cytochrome c1 [Temperatibacter marinus]WND01612.1 cytochrome c1 [Temperatibacter marinus]
MKNLKKLSIAAFAVAAAVTGAVYAAGDAKKPRQVDWSFNGPLGKYERASAQRGFQVFREVCAACHALKYFKFRNLEDIGYPEAQIKAIAAEYTMSIPGEVDSSGDQIERSGLPKDGIPWTFDNEEQATAANGALPPDLSLITKARHDGANYLYSLLTGYDGQTPDGKYKNPYFPGGVITMAPPIMDDLVEYADGTPATADQIAKDVTMFLAYVGEPGLEDHKKRGVLVILFLLVMTILSYFSMKKIWAPVKRGEDVMPSSEE